MEKLCNFLSHPRIELMFIVYMIALLIIGSLVFYFKVYSPDHGGSVQLREDFVSRRTPTSYIFWNGQFPSTFRVLQSLYDENRTVVPIYVDSGTKQDKQRMHQIRATSKKIYAEGDPLFRERLRPVLVVPTKRGDRTTSQLLRETAMDMGHPVELPLAREPDLHPEYTAHSYPNISYRGKEHTRRDMLHKARQGGYAPYLNSCVS